MQAVGMVNDHTTACSATATSPERFPGRPPACVQDDAANTYLTQAY
jgi:hypothetical protein